MPKKNKATFTDARIYLREVFGVRTLKNLPLNVRDALEHNASMGQPLDTLLMKRVREKE